MGEFVNAFHQAFPEDRLESKEICSVIPKLKPCRGWDGLIITEMIPVLDVHVTVKDHPTDYHDLVSKYNSMMTFFSGVKGFITQDNYSSRFKLYLSDFLTKYIYVKIVHTIDDDFLDILAEINENPVIEDSKMVLFYSEYQTRMIDVKGMTELFLAHNVVLVNKKDLVKEEQHNCF
jgi:hypothetical protein